MDIALQLWQQLLLDVSAVAKVYDWVHLPPLERLAFNRRMSSNQSPPKQDLLKRPHRQPPLQQQTKSFWSHTICCLQQQVQRARQWSRLRLHRAASRYLLMDCFV